MRQKIMNADKNQTPKEPTPILAMIIEDIGCFLSNLITKTAPARIKAKALISKYLTLLKKDRMVACTTAICLTILACTWIISSRLGSILYSIPRDTSYTLSEISSNVDNIASNTRQIEGHTSNIGS